MRVGAFKDLLGRRPTRGQSFGIEPSRISYHQKLPREGMDQWWHPNRFGVEQAPDWFTVRLHELSPKLAITRPPGRAPLAFKRRSWLVWCQEPLVTHPICAGWSLLFAWETPDRTPLPLDNRLFANLYARDPRRYPSALHYFDRLMGESQRHEAKKNATFNGETLDMSLDVRNYRKIKNIGMGNKFALYHDGAMIPTQQEILWRQQTLYQRLPEKVRQDAERDGKLTRATHSVSHGVPAYAMADSLVFAQLEAMALQRQLAQQRDRVLVRLRERKRSRVGYTGGPR